jgi:hypothetical protein
MHEDERLRGVVEELGETDGDAGPLADLLQDGVVDRRVLRELPAERGDALALVAERDLRIVAQPCGDVVRGEVSVLPERELRRPARRRAKRFLAEVAEALPARRLPPHEARTLEEAEVLRHGGEAHVERLGERRHRAGAAAQADEGSRGASGRRARRRRGRRWSNAQPLG